MTGMQVNGTPRSSASARSSVDQSRARHRRRRSARRHRRRFDRSGMTSGIVDARRRLRDRRNGASGSAGGTAGGTNGNAGAGAGGGKGGSGAPGSGGGGGGSVSQGAVRWRHRPPRRRRPAASPPRCRSPASAAGRRRGLELRRRRRWWWRRAADERELGGRARRRSSSTRRAAAAPAVPPARRRRGTAGGGGGGGGGGVVIFDAPDVSITGGCVSVVGGPGGAGGALTRGGDAHARSAAASPARRASRRRTAAAAARPAPARRQRCRWHRNRHWRWRRRYRRRRSRDGPLAQSAAASDAARRRFRWPRTFRSRFLDAVRCSLVTGPGPMLVVQKYGGTSVGSVERIREVARRCIATQRAGPRRRGHRLGDVGRDQPPARARQAGQRRPAAEYERELDVIAATGEQVSVGLVSLAIQKAGGAAQSFLGSQVRIITDSAFTRARIQSIDGQKHPRRAQQGRDRRHRRLPGHRRRRQHHDARSRRLGHHRRRDRRGAQGRRLRDLHRRRRRLHDRSQHRPERAQDRAHQLRGDARAGVARRQGPADPLGRVRHEVRRARSTCARASTSNEGTWVVPEEKQMEAVLVSGVTADKNEAKMTLIGVPDKPGIAAKIFQPLSEANIVVDMIIQNISDDGRTDLTFTVPRADLQAHRRAHQARAARDGRGRASRPTTTSPRSRSSASACARTPASRCACSRSWRARGSTSS